LGQEGASTCHWGLRIASPLDLEEPQQGEEKKRRIASPLDLEEPQQGEEKKRRAQTP